MIVDTPERFRAALAERVGPTDRRTTARAAFLVEPTDFRLAAESARDNVYMDLAAQVDPARALAQHRVLAESIGRYLPVQVFPGDAQTPDAVFPNNVFATAKGALLVGAMRHPVRQREAQRGDIPGWFERQHGYRVERLDRDPTIVAELTGPLVVDHARAIGYHGRTERLNDAGVRELHGAFGLTLSFVFDLAPGEYHTNVVMSVLAGRALVIHAPSFVDPDVPRAIAELYAPHVAWLGDVEKNAFAGNCIALTGDSVWMSARAERALSYANRRVLDAAGFTIHTVELDEIEKAGGSLRCCVAEIF
jgi:hypothetical protein